MRTTFTVVLDQELADFILQQPETIDPSAWINKIIHEDIARQNIDVYLQTNVKTKESNSEKLESLIDEQIPAAG